MCLESIMKAGIAWQDQLCGEPGAAEVGKSQKTDQVQGRPLMVMIVKPELLKAAMEALLTQNWS